LRNHGHERETVISENKNGEHPYNHLTERFRIACDVRKLVIGGQIYD